jgi:hypothetical protein
MSSTRRLVIGGAWVSVAVAAEILLSIATFPAGGVLDETTLWAAIAYAVMLGSTFALHRGTRGPLLLAVAFGVCSALLVHGIYFASVSDQTPVPKRIGLAVLLSLPLLALVVRCRSLEADDAWFARRVRRVVPGALVVAFPMAIIGLVGTTKADPKDYDRALWTLDCHPVHALLRPMTPLADERRASEGLYPRRGMSPSIRAEMREGCGRFDAAPELACDCGRALLSRRIEAIEERRDGFRAIALASGLPFAIAAFFAWRGRPKRPESRS